jgi:hypothetical protein
LKELSRVTTGDTPTAPPPPPAPPPAMGQPSSGPVGMFMGALNAAISLVKSPLSFMTTEKDSPATFGSVMINYVAVLAVIPLVATLIGDLWYYSLISRIAGSFVGYAIVSAVLSYVFDIVAVYIIGFAIKTLAPSFGSSNDQMKGLRLAAYAYTPAFLISALNIIPFLGVITFVGVLYGLYILYLGLPVMVGTPKDKVVTYLVAVVVVPLVVYLVIAAIVGSITAAAFLTR